MGSRDAVVAAARRSDLDRRGFPAPASTDLPARLAELAGLAGAGHPAVDVTVEAAPSSDPYEPLVVVRPAGGRTTADRDVLLAAGAVAERLAALGWAERLRADPTAAPAGAVLALATTGRP